MRRNKKKKIIIIGLIGILALMTAGYAAFQTNLNIKGTSKVSSNWNVLITNVTESNKEGEAETVGQPSWTDLTAYMEANLYQKGDFVEYDVTVENRGTLDAKLDGITDNIKSTNEAVKISFSGYTKGEKLYKNTNKTIKVKIEYNPEFTGTVEEGSGEVSVDLNYTQAEGGTVTPTDKYLVTYNCTANGGDNCSSYNEYLNEGDMVNLNHTSSKEGYEFIGWNTNKDAEEGLTELKMANQDITLYAIYKDTTPPACEIIITDATMDDVTVKANCTDASGIKEYNFKNNEGNNVQNENTFKLKDYKLSEITVEVTDKVNNKGIYQINDDNLQKGYQLIYNVLNEKYNTLNEKGNEYENSFLNKTYPVGSIYITDKNENPSEKIGGTWEEYGKGKALVGVDKNNDNLNQVNKIGGTKTNTLAIANLPSHTHNIPSLSGTAAESGKHTHTKGTMNITGSFDIRSYSGEYHDTILDTEGAFSKLVTSWPGEHDILQSTSLNPAYYHDVNFNATNSWTGNTSSDGAHTHTVTTNANITGARGNGTEFTNLQAYTTVYMYKRIS